MLSLLLGFVLATGSVSSDAVTDRDSVSVGYYAPDFAPAQQASQYHSPYLPTQNGRMWLNFGWARVTSEFNSDGDRVDIEPVPGVDGDVTSLALNVGGLYTFYRIGDMNLNAGINFAMANRTLNIGEPVDTDLSSGFSPQNLTIFGEIERPIYSLRLGYLADLGPEAEDDGDYENTDRQSAIQFGASAQHWAGDLRVFGGADYFLTFPRELTDEVDFDAGDVINLNLGAGWNWGSGELGLALLYRIRTEGSTDPEVPGVEFENGWALSAVPYVNYSPLGSNYQVFLKGALQSEYQDYGFALAGKNDIAPRLGFTLGVNYAL